MAIIAFVGACSFVFGAPATVTAVNSVTSTPNVAAPLAYSAVMAFSAASLTLMIQWYGGPEARVRRTNQACGVAYALVTVALFTLFFAGDAPVERRRDFDTYYAGTPFIREMIMVYLVAHLTAALATAVLCARWSRRTTGWVRGSLLLLLTGWISVTAYSVCKLMAVAARWGGRSWDTLSTDVAPALVAVGTCFVMLGYLVPVGRRKLEPFLVVLRLRPLHRLLVPSDSRYTVRLGGLSGLNCHLHLTRRVNAIRDALYRLNGSLDDRVHRRARRHAARAGCAPERVEVLAAAAMISVAARPGRPEVPEEHRGFVSLHEAALVELSQALRDPALHSLLRTETHESAGLSGSSSRPERLTD
ncbi:DUF6545 domain-containing protein [Streptomyces sp. NPDC002644]